MKNTSCLLPEDLVGGLQGTQGDAQTSPAVAVGALPPTPWFLPVHPVCFHFSFRFEIKVSEDFAHLSSFHTNETHTLATPLLQGCIFSCRPHTIGNRRQGMCLLSLTHLHPQVCRLSHCSRCLVGTK